MNSAARGLIASALLAIATAAPALATTYTVDSTADTIAVDGVITLREALTAAVTNAPAGDAPAGTPGLNTINFNIPGPGPHIITLTSALPNITTPVLIDGFTQPGAVSGAGRTLQIEINAPSIFVVFQILGGASSGSTIRGLAINGYQAFGIQIFESSNNTISGNYLELNAAGTAIAGAPATGGVGIIVSGNNNPTDGNVIGGSAPGDGNVIATNGPGFVGIELGANAPGTADGNIIRGNFVGTDKTGTVALADPSSGGIDVLDATHTTVGGSNATPGGNCSGDCNLIAGVGDGLYISGSVIDTLTISGNYIGTDVTGTVALPVGTSDVLINDGVGAISGAITIGGTTAGARNVIASSGTGIEIDGNPASHITIQGNYVGVDVSDSIPLPNSFGIYLRSTAGEKIGGTNPGEANVVSASTVAQIALLSSSNTIIQGNSVGPSVSGNGITISDSLGPATNNQIGASSPGGAGGNTIAFNALGVEIAGATSTGNPIFSNSIFSNSTSAIALTGVGPNDHCDTDSGPNQGQNYPLLNPVLAGGGTMTVGGTLDSAPGQTFRVEFFSNPPGGSQQATTPIGSTTVMTDPASCVGSFSVTLPAAAVGSTITAIATDAAGNSSQLSAPAFVLLPTIQVSKSFTPASIKVFNPSQLTITLTNPNAIAITGVAFTDAYPSGLVNQALPQPSSSCGGTVTATPSGTSLALTGGTIPASGACSVTVMLKATNGPNLVNTIPAGGVTSANAAPSATAATATLTVDVTAIPALSPEGLAALAVVLAMIALMLSPLTKR